MLVPSLLLDIALFLFATLALLTLSSQESAEREDKKRL